VVIPINFPLPEIYMLNKSKAVPLHTMETLQGRGGIAPTCSLHQHLMGQVVSIMAQPCFTPRERTSIPTKKKAGWATELVWMQRLEEKSFFPAREQTQSFSPQSDIILSHPSCYMLGTSTSYNSALKQCKLLRNRVPFQMNNLTT
jgi:hypothetical protein